MQQLQYLQNKEINTDPRVRFDQDLQQLIETKLEDGHKIVLMGDFNILMNKTNRFTSMLSDLGLHGIITNK